MDIEEPMTQPAGPSNKTQWFRARSPWLVLLVLCILLQALGAGPCLEFDRAAIDQGQLWRLLSAHLVHLGWNHLWLNMAGLALVALFFAGYYSARSWLALLLFSSLFTGLALHWLNPQLQQYVGLSGVLHGLFVVGAWGERRRYRLSGYLLLGLIVVKLLWEQGFGALPGSESMAGGHVLVDAHLYGAIAGGLFLLLHKIIHVDDRQQNGQHDEQHHHAHGDD